MGDLLLGGGAAAAAVHLGQRRHRARRPAQRPHRPRQAGRHRHDRATAQSARSANRPGKRRSRRASRGRSRSTTRRPPKSPQIVQQVYQDRMAGGGGVMSPQEMMKMIRGGPNTDQQIQKMSIAVDTRNNMLDRARARSAVRGSEGAGRRAGSGRLRFAGNDARRLAASTRIRPPCRRRSRRSWTTCRPTRQPRQPTADRSRDAATTTTTIRRKSGSPGHAAQLGNDAGNAPHAGAHGRRSRDGGGGFDRCRFFRPRRSGRGGDDGDRGDAAAVAAAIVVGHGAVHCDATWRAIHSGCHAARGDT